MNFVYDKRKTNDDYIYCRFTMENEVVKFNLAIF